MKLISKGKEGIRVDVMLQLRGYIATRENLSFLNFVLVLFLSQARS